MENKSLIETQVNTNNIIQYNNGEIELTVSIESDTIWLSQMQISKLFDTSTDNVSLHLKNIFNDKELDEDSTTEDFSLVRQEGNRKVKRNIITKNITKELKLDIEKNNKQYNNINIYQYRDSHDRFLILDHKTIYHIGSSIKDLGNKWFAFSKMEDENLELLEKVKDILEGAK